MSEPFTLHCKLDQPYLLHGQPGDVHALLSIEPGPALLAAANQAPLPAHLIVLVDVSGSMDCLIRPDPNAKNVGQVKAEGKKAQSVVSSVPSRRETACAVVEKLLARLGPDDRLTLAAFDERPYLLAEAQPPSASDELRQAVRKLGQVGGGGTALGRALQTVRAKLRAAHEPQHTRRLIVLTDGEDDQPELARSEAQLLGRDLYVPLSALGTGECKVAFLSELARGTLAGSFHHLRDEADAEQLFQQLFAGQKNVQATNAVLRLWLSPEVRLGEFYRTRPEILYLGDVAPDTSNQVELRLEQMERGRAYEFLFRCLVPPRPSGQRFRIAKAALTCDLPALDRPQVKVETNVVVEIVADETQARTRSGDVRRTLARAEVQRQVLFLQEKIDALRRGSANPRDRAEVAKLLQALTVKFEQLGDQAMVNHYREVQAEFECDGTISQETLNRSLAASSRAEEIVVAQDLDF
jgi:Ca-activated chloride channel family protein